MYQPSQKAFYAAALPVHTIMGLPVVNATSQETAEVLLADGPQRHVAFVNAHCMNTRAKSPTYARALTRCAFVLPDGIGVEMAARMMGLRFTENLNGTDFVPFLMSMAARKGLTVFLFGGRPGVAQAAANTLARQSPGLRIAGTRDGYDGAQDPDAAIDHINASGADIVLVAMGVPTQELWLDQHGGALTARLVMGVGALFDFLAGEVKRAPAAVRRWKLEWAFRLLQEPKRLAKRYLMGNPEFLLRAGAHAVARLDRLVLSRRALDIAVSGSALLLAAPVFALIAVAIRADSKGSVFFLQTRVGKDGTPFRMMKFRSMHVDAEARRAAILAQSDREGVCFKSRNDPRVTRVGRLLRRLSFDELPQLFNVLKGDMSMVGPRPGLPEEVAAYPFRAMARLAVKPGITGIWQVSGRAEIGFEKMIDMDLAYVQSRSILLDLMLMVLTVRAVVGGRGAY